MCKQRLFLCVYCKLLFAGVSHWKCSVGKGVIKLKPATLLKRDSTQAFS